MIKKSLRRFLLEFFNLDIVYDTNTKGVNFLDVTFYLNAKFYYPYRKPNQIIKYINVFPNHSKSTINSLIRAISETITHVLANEETFNAHAPIYDQAL